MNTRFKYCFNSLQTGKWIQRVRTPVGVEFDCVSIPFKRESGFKGWRLSSKSRKQKKVSIPFKRESGFKASTHGGCFKRHAKSFNSLQTGKWIQSFGTVVKVNLMNVGFQFPSNGKVDSKFFASALVVNADAKKPQKPEVLPIGSVVFQFPSNGKVDSKLKRPTSTIRR